MADAATFPITTPYGKVAGYPLNNGFHNGIDYGAPTGSEVIVNGVVIGLTGATGYATGPHLHVGRWVGGTVTDPGVGGGFHFDSAVVTQISQDATNGKYVRVQGDGASWVYLHLSDNSKVSVGQVLQGDEMIESSDVDEVRIINSEVQGYDFNKTHAGDYDAQEMEAWTGQTWDKLITEKWNSGEAFREKRITAIDYYDNTRPKVEKQLSDANAKIADLEKQLADAGKGYVPVGQLFIKK